MTFGPNVEWVWVGKNDDPNLKAGIKANEYNKAKVREAITEGNGAAKIDTRRSSSRTGTTNTGASRSRAKGQPKRSPVC